MKIMIATSHKCYTLKNLFVCWFGKHSLKSIEKFEDVKKLECVSYELTLVICVRIFCFLKLFSPFKRVTPKIYYQ